ncbi:MAG: hypothetical protein OEV28_03620 [Nitrospirota bacterium]|nr:hypothetical protein [Nitrospirota bacterium]
MRKIKRYLPLLAVAVSPLFLGMGTGDISSSGEVHKATKNYNVTVVDDLGTKTEASNFTCEGKLYFDGKKGATTLSVSFDKVREISAEKGKGDRAQVTATLTDGSTVAFDMSCRDRCSGNTSFGSFSVEACNLRKVTFK